MIEIMGRSPAGRRALKTLNATTGNINAVETVVLQALLAPGEWLLGAVIEFSFLCAIKSGLVDTGTLRLRVGPAGTTADTSISSAAVLAAANRQWNGGTALRLEAASSVLMLGGNNGGFAPGTANGALVAISLGAHNVLTTPTYVSLTLLGGATDSVALAMGSMWLDGKTT